MLRSARTIVIEELPLPEIGEDDGLLRIEATGVCGADWAPYLGQRPDFFEPPLILGHEIVGRVERIGATAAARWGVQVGDRLVLEEPLPCSTCEACLAGRYQMCPARRYGSKSVNDAPSLWGGYSEYLYLDPRAMVHKMSTDVPVEVAPLYIPVSNGIYWVNEIGRAGPGSTVVIQGPGQHGLGCVVAAREAGAGTVIVTGLAVDEARFSVAQALGADHVIAIDRDDAVAAVKDITGGRMADTVVNVTEKAPTALADAVHLAGDRATIVNAGRSHQPSPGFDGDQVMSKELTLVGVRGRYGSSITKAIEIIESGRHPLHLLCTHTFSVDETELALQTLGREHGDDAIHISVVPGA